MADNSDKRFAHVLKDPKFQRISKKQTKVVIDDRFKGMFSENRFNEKYYVNKYGDRVRNDNSAQSLKKYYRIDEAKKNQKNSIQEKDKNEKKSTKKKIEVKDVEESEEDSEVNDENEQEDEEEEEEDIENGVEEEEEEEYDPARGKGVISSSEEESDDEEEEEEGEEIFEEENEEDTAFYEQIAEERENAPEGDPTRRLALVNMDWDRLRAIDILKIVESFIAKEHSVLSVKIYKSEFGKERLEQEQRVGPPANIFKKKEEEEEEEEESKPLNRKEKEKDDEFDPVALRKYQLERLKYYYAVIEFSSVDAANSIYDNCNGLELERTSNTLDFRFIPDDMEFDDEPVQTTHHVEDNYKPVNFTTKALQHSKVQLTWDEDKYDRMLVTRRKITKEDIENLDLTSYIASSGESDLDSEGESKEAMRNKYKQLLGEVGTEDDRDQEMEITFTSGLTEVAQDLLKKKKENDEKKGESVWESYLRKKKEIKKEKKKAAKEKRENKGKDEENEKDDIPEEFKSDPFFQQKFGEEFEQPKADEKKKKKKTKQEEKEEQQQKAELELLMIDERDDGKQKHFNLKDLLKEEKKKGSKKAQKKLEKEEKVQEDQFQVDLHDPRFSAIYDSHLYALDPSHPQFKKTKGMQQFLDERQKKIKSKPEKAEPKKVDQKTKMNPELSLLVNSVKRKTETLKGQGKRQKIE